MASDLLRTLILATLASSAAMLLVLATRKPLRLRFGAHAAYAQWALVPLSALVALLPAPVSSVPMQIELMAVTTVAESTTAVVLPIMSAFDPSPWLAALWLMGAAVVSFLLIRQQRRFVRGLGQLSASGGDETLRAQTIAGCPALLGAWRPRIVLPFDFEQRYSADERKLILAHERTHRARGDAQINALAAALRCTFWFNPLIHFAASRFRFDQELACDAVVISCFPEARRSYAHAMLKTQLAADSTLFAGLPVGCHWQSSHPLKERIVMLKQPLPGRTRAALGLGIAAALIVGGTYAAWASQPATQVAAKQPAKSATDSITTAADHPASYRKLSRIDYPEQAPVDGDCIAIVTLSVDASGVIEDLSSLTTHGSAPSCGSWAGKAAATIMAKHWTFEPATANGKPVASKVIVPVVFTAHPNDKFDGSSIPKEALDAIRISAPQTANSASADTPPTENVSFRRSDPPKYPQAALDAHQSAKVMLKVLVDETGTPKSVEIVSTDPPQNEKLFADASIAAAMEWRYNPRVKDGKPRAGYVLVPITYSLDKQG